MGNDMVRQGMLCSLPSPIGPFGWTRVRGAMVSRALMRPAVPLRGQDTCHHVPRRSNHDRLAQVCDPENNEVS